MYMKYWFDVQFFSSYPVNQALLFACISTPTIVALLLESQYFRKTSEQVSCCSMENSYIKLLQNYKKQKTTWGELFRYKLSVVECLYLFIYYKLDQVGNMSGQSWSVVLWGFLQTLLTVSVSRMQSGFLMLICQFNAGHQKQSNNTFLNCGILLTRIMCFSML